MTFNDMVGYLSGYNKNGQSEQVQEETQVLVLVFDEYHIELKCFLAQPFGHMAKTCSELEVEFRMPLLVTAYAAHADRTEGDLSIWDYDIYTTDNSMTSIGSSQSRSLRCNFQNSKCLILRYF
nr:hypothetical protein Iba_chr12bCG5250 [Ipomoea batatas]